MSDLHVDGGAGASDESNELGPTFHGEAEEERVLGPLGWAGLAPGEEDGHGMSRRAMKETGGGAGARR